MKLKNVIFLEMVFADTISEGSQDEIILDLERALNPMTGSFTRWRRGRCGHSDTQRRWPCEDRGRDPTNAVTAKEVPYPGALKGKWPCWHLDFGLCERINFCCFVTNLSGQPQETNTLVLELRLDHFHLRLLVWLAILKRILRWPPRTPALYEQDLEIWDITLAIVLHYLAERILMVLADLMTEILLGGSELIRWALPSKRWYPPGKRDLKDEKDPSWEIE